MQKTILRTTTKNHIYLIIKVLTKKCNQIGVAAFCTDLLRSIEAERSFLLSNLSDPPLPEASPPFRFNSAQFEFGGTAAI